MQRDLSRNPWEALALRQPSWNEDGEAARPGEDAPIGTRPSWSAMVAQLAGRSPEPIRVSDYGRGSRVISRALSGDHGERDLDDEDDDTPRPPMH